MAVIDGVLALICIIPVPSLMGLFLPQGKQWGTASCPHASAVHTASTPNFSPPPRSRPDDQSHVLAPTPRRPPRCSLSFEKTYVAKPIRRIARDRHLHVNDPALRREPVAIRIGIFLLTHACSQHDADHGEHKRTRGCTTSLFVTTSNTGRSSSFTPTVTNKSRGSGQASVVWKINDTRVLPKSFVTHSLTLAKRI
ncbi:MAG: hypothetical protein Ct9H300mP8_00500 [Gammaproteobacteria bacterium]|nr:MAG: hypothetical protein Ct9H300mP8_00500 [Gammaproteobacteria bacterium]